MLVVNAPVSAQKFVEIVVKQAYKAGARNVEVQWTDEIVSKLNYKYRSKKELAKVPEWVKVRSDSYRRKNRLSQYFSEDPECLKGINPERSRFSEEREERRWKNSEIIPGLINSAGALSLTQTRRGQKDVPFA